MPTTALHTYTNARLEPFLNPEEARMMAVKIPNSTTLAKGTVLGEVTATPGTYNTYADAGAGGLDTARAILAYDVATDANGAYTIGGATGGGEHGQTTNSVPAYYKGVFKTTDLVGLTDAAVADLGRLIEGTAADGILAIG